jgi:hypothetical protein
VSGQRNIFCLFFKEVLGRGLWGADHESKVYLAGNPVASATKNWIRPSGKALFWTTAFSTRFYAESTNWRLNHSKSTSLGQEKWSSTFGKTTFSRDHFPDVSSTVVRILRDKIVFSLCWKHGIAEINKFVSLVVSGSKEHWRRGDYRWEVSMLSGVTLLGNTNPGPVPAGREWLLGNRYTRISSKCVHGGFGDMGNPNLGVCFTEMSMVGWEPMGIQWVVKSFSLLDWRNNRNPMLTYVDKSCAFGYSLEIFVGKRENCCLMHDKECGFPWSYRRYSRKT